MFDVWHLHEFGDSKVTGWHNFSPRTPRAT
jgi:hypothetical protein